MDLCLIEIVQVEKNKREEAQSMIADKPLNMYMVIFKRPEDHEDTNETIELFNNLFHAALTGLTQITAN